MPSTAGLTAAKAILSKALFVPLDRIGDDADLNSIKPLDSLAFEALVLEIERHIGKDLDVVQLIGVKSVGDLATVLDQLG